MKKIAFMAFLCLGLLSCTNKADEYEQAARQEMEKVMKKVAQNPETFQISDIQTTYKQDSICILQFSGSGSAGNDNYSSQFEFVMLTTKQHTENQLTMCMLQDLKENMSVLDNYQGMKINLPANNSKKFTKEDSIYYNCFSTVVSQRRLYNSVVADLTKDKKILEKLKKDTQNLRK